MTILLIAINLCYRCQSRRNMQKNNVFTRNYNINTLLQVNVRSSIFSGKYIIDYLYLLRPSRDVLQPPLQVLSIKQSALVYV